MKQFITFLALIFSYMLCGAQATALVVDNQTPGWLSSKINYGEQQTVESLTITGYINASDLKFIGSLMQKQKLHHSLNLSEVCIVGEASNDDNEISYDNIFGLTAAVNVNLLSLPKSIITPTPKSNTKPFRYLSVDTLIYGSETCQIYNNALWGYTSAGGSGAKHLVLREGITAIANYACEASKTIETVECPSTIKTIGKAAFKNCKQLHSINLPNSIETIDFEALSETTFLPDSLLLPELLTKYYTTAFPKKNGQVVIIPESVTQIDNTYKTYNNTTNIWTTWDYIGTSNNYTWVMNSMTPPSTTYHYEGFLEGSTIYVPKGSYSDYSSKKPFSLAKIIEVIPIEEISFNSESLCMFVDENLSAKPIITPSNATNKELLWTSLNPDVATVDDSGNIKGLKYGHTVITATTLDGQKSASFNLLVYEHITSISLPTSLSLNISEKSQLIPEIFPIGKNDGKVFWISSDQDIATVDENGFVKGISKGSCNITVTTSDGGFSATCKIEVIQPVESITVTPKSLTIQVGDNSRIVANVLPSNANDKSVTWSSFDNSIVKVNPDGVVSGVKPGVTKITATSHYNNEIYDVCEVIVLQPTTGIALDKTDVEITEDESIQLIATVLPENASNKNVNWTSSDISVAMVSPDGTVYALKAGQATIMATTVDGGFVALCKVIVKAKTIQISNIELLSNSESIAVGETLQLNAIISPDNASNKTVNWTSTNPSIASVNASGLVTAIAEGKTQIIATTTDGSNLSAICEIIVNKQFILVSQIQITPSSARIPVGQPLNLNAIITPNDATNKSIKWSSTNPAVATVSESGIVSAISEGNAIVIASTQDGSNLSAMCQIEVYKETILVETINLNPTKVEGAVNDTFKIEAIVLPTNATNKNLTWKSSDESIVTVDNGVITLHALGTAIISAEAMDGSNVKSECTIIVSHEAGIDSIIADKESYVKVFNLSGYLVYEGIYSEAKLAPGFYIVLCNGASYKTKVD